jgi:tetratricopeptide (TPR) repeat protein
VFRDYGIDVQTLPPQEAAARIRARRIWLELVLGLDDWLLVGSWKTHLDSWKALLALARAADPDPWRNRLRETLQPQKRKAVLRKLAAADNPRNLATANLFLLNHSPTIADAPELVISVMRQAREHNPSDFWVNLGLAYSLNKLNPPQKDESIRYFSVASALRPDSHFVHCNLGVLLANKGRLDEAIAYYKTAIRLKPDFALAHSNLGSAQWKKGNQDEAVACYRKAMEVDPKSAQAHVGLGNIRKHQGKLDEAIACYRKAIGIDPKYAKAHTGLGNVLFEQKKLDEAIVCYRKVIELDPKD